MKLATATTSLSSHFLASSCVHVFIACTYTCSICKYLIFLLPSVLLSIVDVDMLCWPVCIMALNLFVGSYLTYRCRGILLACQQLPKIQMPYYAITSISTHIKSGCTRNRTSFLIPHAENWFGREAKADEYLPAKKCIGKSMFCLVLDRNTAAKDCIFVKKKSPEKIMGI